MTTWQQWNDRLVPIWAEVFSGHVYLDSNDDGRPVLFDGSVPLPLSPSFWGLGAPEEDDERLTKALEEMVQGRAPDYWRTSSDPLIHALGWLDKRIGNRSMDRWRDQVGEPRNALEQALRATRIRAEACSKSKVKVSP